MSNDKTFQTKASVKGKLRDVAILNSFFVGDVEHVTAIVTDSKSGKLVCIPIADVREEEQTMLSFGGGSLFIIPNHLDLKKGDVVKVKFNRPDRASNDPDATRPDEIFTSVTSVKKQSALTIWLNNDHRSAGHTYTPFSIEVSEMKTVWTADPVAEEAKPEEVALKFDFWDYAPVTNGFWIKRVDYSDIKHGVQYLVIKSKGHPGSPAGGNEGMSLSRTIGSFLSMESACEAIAKISQTESPSILAMAS